MMYSLACRDSGADCPGSFTTETQEELMKHVDMHVREAHPEMELNDEMREKVSGLVKVA